MKTLLLLSGLFFLRLVNVAAQDTSKIVKPDTGTTRNASQFKGHRPTLKELFLPPRERHRKYSQLDSAYQVSFPEHHHPGVYFDFSFGGAFAGITGLEGNYSLNYENKNSLFTFRGLGTVAFTTRYTSISPYDYFPDYKTSNSLGEYALLYGWRFINNHNSALSVSIGISSDRRTYYYYYPNTPTEKTNEYYAGLPFEANYNWFMSRFGVGGGFKVSGNISQHSFIGIGIDMSVGFHKTH